MSLSLPLPLSGTLTGSGETVTSSRAQWKDKLLTLMAEGKHLRQACREPGMPSYMTVYRETARDKVFGDELAEARKNLCLAQQDNLDEDMAEARRISPDKVPGLRLANEILRFKLVKVLPKLYGDPQAAVNVNVDARTVVVTEGKRKELQDKLRVIQDSTVDSQSTVLPSKDQAH